MNRIKNAVKEKYAKFKSLERITKAQIFVIFLWFCTGILTLSMPEISKVSYGTIWIIYLLTAVNQVSSEMRHVRIFESTMKGWSKSASRNFELSERIHKASRRNLELMKHIRDTRIKICDLPKMATATGQVYVDFDEVLKILKGDDVVER